MTNASVALVATLISTLTVGPIAVAQETLSPVTPTNVTPQATAPVKDAPVVPQTSTVANDAPIVPQVTTGVRTSNLNEPTRVTTYLPQNPVYNISTLDERLRQYLPNLKRPTLALMTSGQPMPQAWKNVADAGVKTVINLRPAGELGVRDERGEVLAAGLKYVEIPVADATSLTPASARTLWDALRNARGGVLVHCSSGDRAGALLALAAHREGKLSPKDALEFGRNAGLNQYAPVVDAILHGRALPATPEK